MKRIALLVLALAPWITASANQNDGNWWLGLTRQQKLYYVLGVCDGTVYTLVQDDKIEASKGAGNVEVPQLADGLDRFYEDFRNRGIWVIQALTPVKMAIAGENHTKVITEIESLRSVAARLPNR
jgi:hypothetical protein